MMQQTQSKQGFSLLELAIILVIFGAITSMSVILGTQWVEKERLDTTTLNMELISTSLHSYVKANGRLPCPADISLTEASDFYGLEALENFAPHNEAPGDCDDTTGNIIADVTSNASVFMGAVPANTLGLSESMMRDQWGHLFVYYVHERATGDSVFIDTSTDFIPVDDTAIGSIIIQDRNGNVRTGQAVYALLSHGPNGHGGYNDQGNRTDENITEAHQLENCDCDDDAVDTGINDTLVSGLSFDDFDDIVIFKTRPQLGQ